MALALPGGELDAVVGLQRRLRRLAEEQGHRLRWSSEEQLHVTVKFLGTIPRAQLPAFRESVARRAEEHAPIGATLGGVSAFGGRRARVLLVSVADPSGALARLAAALEDDAALLGVPREARAFVPHVTLGRLRVPTDASALLAAAPPFAHGVRFAALRLYESVTAPEGARYTVLAEAQLGGG